jgi:hypothetical protein
MLVSKDNNEQHPHNRKAESPRASVQISSETKTTVLSSQDKRNLTCLTSDSSSVSASRFLVARDRMLEAAFVTRNLPALIKCAANAFFNAQVVSALCYIG